MHKKRRGKYSQKQFSPIGDADKSQLQPIYSNWSSFT